MTSNTIDTVWPKGSTRLVAVIGDPVSHSLSPILHNCAFKTLGLDWVYTAFTVRQAQLDQALEGVRALGIEGLSVTMPHKVQVVKKLDSCSKNAQILGAVNTISRIGNNLIGHNTDGDGFVDAIKAELGFDVASKRCLIIGAGGAARSIALSLAQNQAEKVMIVARDASRAIEVANLAGKVGQVVSPEAAKDAELIINATPLGMKGFDTSFPINPSFISPGQIFVDLIYFPLQTPMAKELQKKQVKVLNGVAMLLYQAARAFNIWTGQEAPIEQMSKALMNEIANFF